MATPPVQDTEELIILDDTPTQAVVEEPIIQEETQESTEVIDFGSEDSQEESSKEENILLEEMTDMPEVSSETEIEENQTETSSSDLFDFSDIAEEKEEVEMEESSTSKPEESSTDLFGGFSDDSSAGDDKNMDSILDKTIAELDKRLISVQDQIQKESELEANQIKKNIGSIKRMKSSEMTKVHNTKRKKAA
ncbi:hypothetical protein MK079_02630 [Candidatus Gracilibacteria bacterium]|nr:hypothetical protein [Candidatus Gracilibacteria bacterium]